jgi:lactate dehydrogenase-like 2-hydroxyacid dehydrogenase
VQPRFYVLLITITMFARSINGSNAPSAKRHGVIVTNTPDILNDCVADLAICMCIGIARKVVQSDAFVRSGSWLVYSFPLGVKFSGKRLGILGMGRIGQEIAARASAFKMCVSYHSRRKASVPFTYYDTLLALAENSDFLGILIAQHKPNLVVAVPHPVFQSSILMSPHFSSLLSQSSSVRVVPPPFTSSTIRCLQPLAPTVFL